MENCLKSYFVYGTVAVLAACQTPPASNRGSTHSEAAALNAQSASRSSPYETEAFNPFQQSRIQWSHGGGIRGPREAPRSQHYHFTRSFLLLQRVLPLALRHSHGESN